jgi:DNA-binding XRE family transcriptional regulator
VHTLQAKQVDVANIARQVGVSRQTVYPIYGGQLHPNARGSRSADPT